MADEEHEEPAKRSKRWVWFVTLPIFYVLSIGPVCWLQSFVCSRAPADWDLLGITNMPIYVVYAPLLYLAHYVGWLYGFLSWYIDLIQF